MEVHNNSLESLETIILLKYLPQTKIPVIVEKLKSQSDTVQRMALSLNYRNPTTMIFISIFFGGWGIDRFSIGSIGIGLIKLMAQLATLLCCFATYNDRHPEIGWFVPPVIQTIIWFIDCFCIHSATKKYNYNKFLKAISPSDSNLSYDDDKKPVVIRRYDNPVSANIAKEQLLANGIGCMLTNELNNGIMPFFNTTMSGVSLMVLEKDEETAISILNNQIDIGDTNSQI